MSAFSWSISRSSKRSHGGAAKIFPDERDAESDAVESLENAKNDNVAKDEEFYRARAAEILALEQEQ